MNPADFTPGIEFKTRERSHYVWKYDPYTADDGKLMHIAYHDGVKPNRFQLYVSDHGIQFWDFLGDVYVQSKLIPYSDLHLISKPVTA